MGITCVIIPNMVNYINDKEYIWMVEFNLSKEIIRDSENVDVLLKGSVKEFIRLLKELLTPKELFCLELKIDELAGDKFK